MDIRKVKKLIELLDESGIAEIEITEGEEAVRISRYPTGGVAQVPPMPMMVTIGTAAFFSAWRINKPLLSRPLALATSESSSSISSVRDTRVHSESRL